MSSRGFKRHLTLFERVGRLVTVLYHHQPQEYSLGQVRLLFKSTPHTEGMHHLIDSGGVLKVAGNRTIGRSASWKLRTAQMWH
jgi:hypothetical protein